MSAAPLDRVAGFLRRAAAPPASDAELLGRCAGRDQEAFAILARRHGPAVQRRRSETPGPHEAVAVALAANEQGDRWRRPGRRSRRSLARHEKAANSESRDL